MLGHGLGGAKLTTTHRYSASSTRIAKPSASISATIIMSEPMYSAVRSKSGSTARRPIEMCGSAWKSSAHDMILCGAIMALGRETRTEAAVSVRKGGVCAATAFARRAASSHR